MNTAYLLTGGNVGNRQQFLDEAARLIAAKCGKIKQKSAVYETGAWGKTDQAAFLNQALQLQTQFSANDLMQHLLAIEQEIGRVRIEKYGPRTIDIDMLLFNSEIIETELVTIPHPRMQERRFVLVPLQEIAGNYIHPVLQKSISILLYECPDELPVKKFSVL